MVILFVFVFISFKSEIINDTKLLQNLFEKTTFSKISKSELKYFENAAVIVELRSTPLLITIILNVIQNIPDHWPIQIFHCKLNAQFIRKSRLSKYIENEKIILTELDHYVGNFHHFTNILFTNISFWKQVRGDKILVFQIDSIMCSNSPHKITDYLQYDYIGAPWDAREPRVGNGGFSWRSKSKTIILLEKMRNSSSRYAGKFNEDVWYSIHMSSVGLVAPWNVSRTFAVESTFYETPLGVHKMGIKGEELKKLCEACPEARLIPPYCI